jgi:hypothetical protein
MFPGAPTLPELLRLHAQHHNTLKAFVLAKAMLWHDAAIRRTARQGLAVLAAMLRRLLHLMAREVALPPLRPQCELAPMPRLTPPRARPPRFRLIEGPRERPPRARNPAPMPDTPQLAHAIVLERLAVLASVWRRRHRIARRLARRVRGGLATLYTPALPVRDHARLPRGFADLLDFLDVWIEHPPRPPP